MLLPMLLLSKYAKPSAEQARDRVDPEHTRVFVLTGNHKLVCRLFSSKLSHRFQGILEYFVRDVRRVRDKFAKTV